MSAAILGFMPELQPFARVFACMEIAQTEIEAMQRQHPEHARVLHSAFAVLAPGELAHFGDQLYRAHVRELLDRVVEGIDLDLGTDAEVLAVLHRGSLRAPLSSQPQALFESLFARMFRADFERLFPGSKPSPEPWPGSSRELAGQLRRALARRQKRVTQDAPGGPQDGPTPGLRRSGGRRRKAATCSG